MGFFCGWFFGGFVGFSLRPQLQVVWLLLHILQPDFGTSSVVMAAVITFNNVCLKTQFCPEVVQALGTQLVETYNQRIMQS